MKKKFELIETTCRRCGKKIYTGNRSLFGFDKEKAELDRICDSCITPEEKHKTESLNPIRRIE
jgi:ribosomal protein L37E